MGHVLVCPCLNAFGNSGEKTSMKRASTSRGSEVSMIQADPLLILVWHDWRARCIVQSHQLFQTLTLEGFDISPTQDKTKFERDEARSGFTSSTGEALICSMPHPTVR